VQLVLPRAHRTSGRLHGWTASRNGYSQVPPNVTVTFENVNIATTENADGHGEGFRTAQGCHFPVTNAVPLTTKPRLHRAESGQLVVQSS